MPHLVSLPVVKGDGYPKVFCSEDPTLVARWVTAEDRPGRGIYRIMNPLVEGARVHSKENLAGILYIYVDIDTKDIEETAEDVERRLQELPLKPTWITRSGHGWHVVWELKECVDRGDDYYELAIEFQAQLINWLAADRLVRPWTILRLPGTTNYKREPYVPCEVMMTGDPVDITEVESLCDLVVGATLFTRKPAPEQTNGHDQYFDPGYKEPINVDQRLADMAFKGPGGAAIHQTQLQVTASLIRRGMSLESAVLTVLEDTQKAVAHTPQAADWNWDKERLDLERQCYDWIKKHPELSAALPDELRDKFEQMHQEGVTPKFIYRPDYGGWQCKWPHGQKRLRVVGGTAHPEESGARHTDEAPNPRPRPSSWSLSQT